VGDTENLASVLVSRLLIAAIEWQVLPSWCGRESLRNVPLYNKYSNAISNEKEPKSLLAKFATLC